MSEIIDFQTAVQDFVTNQVGDTMLDTAEFARQLWIAYTQDGSDQNDAQFREYAKVTKEIRHDRGLQVEHVDLTYDNEMLKNTFIGPLEHTLSSELQVTTFFKPIDRHKASNNVELGFDFIGYSPNQAKEITSFAQKKLNKRS